MKVTIRKIGNSEGIIIPKEVLNALNVKAGDQLELTNDNAELILKAAGTKADFARKMAVAKERMKKYEVALRELAK